MRKKKLENMVTFFNVPFLLITVILKVISLKIMLKYFLLSVFISGVVSVGILPFLQTPRHDGVRRVCRLTSENFTTVVNAADTAVVVVKDPLLTSRGACPTELETFAEIAAQVLRKKNSIVCEVFPEVISAQIAGTAAVNPGDVYIYKKGRGIPYYGKRSTRALLNHLFKVNATQVNVITGKIDKIAFDAVEQVKLVGFFMQGTADYLAFEEAASLLSPSVAFYVTFDRMVAKHLKLSTVGAINLVKPFTKTPVPCPQNPASAADIEAFAKANEGVLLSKITEQNLYDPALLDSKKILILAVGDDSSSLGSYFYRLVTKLARNSTNNTEFQNLNIVWVDPNVFPTIHLVMEEMEATLGIPNKLPAFGALNITTLQSSWLDTSTLNGTGDKNADAQNLQILQDFLTGVITNTVTPVKIGGQSFVQTPTSQTVFEYSDAILECVVENQVGDCLWLKDGRNIGYNLDRHPDYSWRGDNTLGDCSLLIEGVSISRDSGEWVCEVTGDQDNPTLTSPPIKLLVMQRPQPVILSPATLIEANVGESVSFRCHVENLGDNILLWIKNKNILFAGDLRITKDMHLQINGTALLINSTRPEDSAEYICQVTSLPPVELTHTLNVLSANPKGPKGEL